MPHTTRPPFKQRGLTLIELMVALIIGFMVILAAMSVFTSTSRSSNTVDAAGQLRDDARFAADIIQRLAVQTGFEDIGFVTRTYQGTPKTYKAVNGDVDPLQMQAPIGGFTGAMPGDATYNPSSKKFSIAQGAAHPPLPPRQQRRGRHRRHRRLHDYLRRLRRWRSAQRRHPH